MKIIKKILIILLVVFTATFFAGYVFVSIFAKNIIRGQIQSQLKLTSDARSVSLGLPLNLEINGFVLGDLAKIKKIKIYPSIIGLLSGKIILNNITLVNPEITLERRRDETFNLPQLPQGKNQIIIAGLIIDGGAVSITDRKAADEPFSFTIKNVGVKIYKASPLPYPVTIKYAVSADIPSRAGIKQARAEGSGIIDWSRKNMRGDFKISGIDVMFFKPYFGKIVSSAMPLETARADFNADLSAENNGLLIKCNFKVTDLAAPKETAEAEPPAEKSSAEEALAMLGIGLLKNNQNEINLEFEIKTKLNNPKFNNINLKGRVVQNVIENALENPQTIVDAVKTIGGQFKGEGKTLEKTLKEIFKKDSRDSQE